MSTEPSLDAVPPPGCPAHAGQDRPAPSGVPLYGAAFADDPAAVYAELRALGPVAPVLVAEDVEASLVVSYEAALQLLRSPETFSKDPRRWKAVLDGRIPPTHPVMPMMGYRPNALFTDGEEHARFRSAISDSLDRVDPIELREYVRRAADTLIDGFGPDGKTDLRREYALVVPLLVFMEMFGCPSAIAEKLVRGMSGIFDVVDAEKSNALLLEGMVELVALKRAQPGADVTSWLMAHPADLTDEEMVHQLVVLMGAGTEPQQNLISNSLRLLLSDDRFAGDLSGGSMPIEDALDEVLWSDPPMANYGVHFPVRDVDLHGVRLREGEPVVVSFAAANTDPALTTDHRAGNRAHLAWSAGPHTCPAKDGARLIATVAIERLLDRLPDIELAVPAERLRWRPGPFHRALAELPVVYPPLTVVRPAPRAPQTAPTTAPPSATPEPQLGESPWQNSPAPTSSTPRGATSTVRTSDSAPEARRRWWHSLAVWRHGR
ncbi:cytochrome P450 [Yinghuangia seranimata]|uniref:cytochrome P450 n=1 Tax=Yinghuangia seranimata TaxID=408067 RepID=UPI00248BB8C1|nr:cytochrome P450 [Yinghuangia seranimata]MDI2132546.1 cytochrome P450 [Yinghuangia seranimata]